MARDDTSAKPRGPRQPPRALFGLVNPLITLLLRSPFHGVVSKSLILLSMTGRKSGRRYQIPVGYTRVDDTLYFGTNGIWKNNLRDGAAVRVRLRGKQRSARAYVIDNQPGMEQSYPLWLPQSPQYARVLGMPLKSGEKPNPEYVTYLREHGHVIVRLELEPPHR